MDLPKPIRESLRSKCLSSCSQPENTTFYDIPNHFPTLTKGGFSQWLPRQFKIAVPKNIQPPSIFPGHGVAQLTPTTQDSPPRRFPTPKLSKNQVTPEILNSFNSKTKETEKLRNKRKMISLCDELEFTVRKIPCFQIKGIPTPTHNRYELMKTISPLKINVELPEPLHRRTFTGHARKMKKFKNAIPEFLEQEKRKNKENIFSYFLDLIRASNGISNMMTEVKNFKFYVGSGNNSGLIVRLMRNRPWWIQTDNRKEANFVWTSLKHQKTLNGLATGKKIRLASAVHTKIPKKKTAECEKFGFNLILASKHFLKLECPETLSSNLKICNKLEENEHISSKKLLFINLKNYFEMNDLKVFDVVPITFHVKSVINDPGFEEFKKFYSDNNVSDSSKNIWIIKPGENTNRGKGIKVSSSLEEISEIVSQKSSTHTCIIQKYIENPLLINKRKFDIRCFVLLTSINSNIQGYFYTEGYIRTSSKEFTTKNLESKFIHLTNDAVQKNSEDYGRFEPGNKMSYNDLQNYINENDPSANIDFEKDIHSQIKGIVKHSINAIFESVDPNKRQHCFELFGYDFMIDEKYKVWLIEANTNPCLETGCAFLSRIIPACLDNTFRIALDPLFPPPYDTKKTMAWVEDACISNKFELIFNEFKEVNSL